MGTYLAMLRGINVSGQKSVIMDDLRLLLGQNGFVKVKTYIQSGNVILSHDESDQRLLSKRIEDIIFKRYQFRVPVLIRKADEIVQVLKNNPFLKENQDTAKIYVTFLSENPEQKYIDTLSEFPQITDRFQQKGKEVYLYIPGGYGKTKLSNTFFENKLKVTATTRNWNLVVAVSSMIESL
jgi:uncharacterized protein (DUF1697 family)